MPSNRPLQYLLRDVLAQKINSKELPPRSGIPEERELSRTYHLSLATTRKALKLLEAEGLIASSGGEGFVVAARDP